MIEAWWLAIRNERKRVEEMERAILVFNEVPEEEDPVPFNDVVPRPAWNVKATKNQRHFNLPRNKVRR